MALSRTGGAIKERHTWSEEEEKVLYLGMEKGWDYEKILKEIKKRLRVSLQVYQIRSKVYRVRRKRKASALRIKDETDSEIDPTETDTKPREPKSPMIIITPKIKKSGICRKRGKGGPVCQNSHPLEPFKTPESGYECDVCRKDGIKQGAQMYGCRVCDWDVCNDCVRTYKPYKPKGAFWSWEDDESWKMYDPETSTAIEKAFKKDKEFFILDFGRFAKRPFQVKFTDFSQVDLNDAQFSRRVRRQEGSKIQYAKQPSADDSSDNNTPDLKLSKSSKLSKFPRKMPKLIAGSEVKIKPKSSSTELKKEKKSAKTPSESKFKIRYRPRDRRPIARFQDDMELLKVMDLSHKEYVREKQQKKEKEEYENAEREAKTLHPSQLKAVCPGCGRRYRNSQAVNAHRRQCSKSLISKVPEDDQGKKKRKRKRYIEELEDDDVEELDDSLSCDEDVIDSHIIYAYRLYPYKLKLQATQHRVIKSAARRA
ncbi:hypothetical protein AAMO2058_000572900 [Amorphochlora amoebiformis]